jgi:hypothetical protein
MSEAPDHAVHAGGFCKIVFLMLDQMFQSNLIPVLPQQAKGERTPRCRPTFCQNFLYLLFCSILSPNFLTFLEPRNLFQGINSTSLCSLAGRYESPISTRLLANIDYLKTLALVLTASRKTGFIDISLQTSLRVSVKHIWPSCNNSQTDTSAA